MEKIPRYRSRLLRISMWTGGALLSIAIVLGAVLSISDWSFARKNIESLLASRLHRDVSIQGPIIASLLTTRPRVHATGITIGNPEWAGSRNLAEIGKIDIVISLRELLGGDWVFESLTVDEPAVALIRDQSGRTNFDLNDPTNESDANPAPKESARRTPSLPVVRRFTLRGGTLYVRDEVHRLTFEGRVEASEKLNIPSDDPFRLRGEGTLNGEPFALSFRGGALANLRMGEAYSFEAGITAGKTRGNARGEFGKPFDFATISALLDVQGENLAHLYYLTNLALPFTPPYRFKGEVQSSREQITVHHLDGKIGNSDIKGTVTVELAGERPKLIAQLRSQSLNFADLSPALGKGIRTDSAGDALDSVAPDRLPPDKVFPVYRFQFDRLRAMDAEMTLQAASVQAKRVPFQKVNIRLRLDDSILLMDPVVMTLPQGRLSGSIRVNAAKSPAHSDIQLRLTDVQLEQFKGKQSEPPLDGVLHARMNIAGTGNSVHEIFATAEGQLQAVIPHGEIRSAFAELTGINVARGLGLLLANDKTRATVRCGVASVNIHQGNADVTQMIFDTEAVLIKGDGHIELNQEKLDLDIKGHSKHLRLGRVRSPITVNGTLRKPTVGIDAGDASKQVGIAALLGTLFAPLSAALAFIDPGLAKDENCASLLAEAHLAQAPLTPNKPVPQLAISKSAARLESKPAQK